jgi:hypothetical protein
MGSSTTPKPTIVLDIKTLNAASARLFDHAESVTNVARQDIADDLMLAARIADKLAGLRLRVAEIAQQALDRPRWDAAAFARDINAALDEAEST